MHQSHNPEIDGYCREWYITGLDGLALEQYRKLLQLMGKLGLLVTVSETSIETREDSNTDFSITREALRSHAQSIVVNSQVASRAWTALTHQHPQRVEHIEAAHMQYAIEGGRVAGVSRQSVEAAIANGSLFNIYGFRDPESEARQLLTDYLAASVTTEV